LGSPYAEFGSASNAHFSGTSVGDAVDPVVVLGWPVDGGEVHAVRASTAYRTLAAIPVR